MEKYDISKSSLTKYLVIFKISFLLLPALLFSCFILKTTSDSDNSKNIIYTSLRNDTVSFTQPDGTVVDVILNGDPYFMRAESTDGYTLVFDESTGWVCYGQLSKTGDQIISSGIHYTNKDKESREFEQELIENNIRKKLKYTSEQIQETRQDVEDQLTPLPLPDTSSQNRTFSGNFSQLVILVDFPDRPANINISDVRNSYDGTSGDTVRTWVKTISNGNVNLKTYVIGYYRAKYPTTHYLATSTYDYSPANELKNDVLIWADANFNFSTLSKNANGRVTNFVILYAGDIIATGWANSLWPHAGGSSYVTNDGVTTGSYYMSSMGKNVPRNLWTDKHELGHSFFGWPDTYDYDGDSHGAGGFAMETALPWAPFRAMNGWINVININNRNQLYDLPADANTALKYTNPSNPKEYFMIEYVKRSGMRSKAPDEGILIVHAETKNGGHSYNQMTLEKHFAYSVEQADGLFELERHLKGGSDGDLFHAGYKVSFNDNTGPNSRWWNGAASGLKVSEIGQKGGSSMRVRIGKESTGPAGYTWCANEGGSFSLPGNSDVAYGANGKYTYQYNKSGTIRFNNNTFGDPVPGVVKSGYYKLSTVSNGPAGYIWCAKEGGSFTLPGNSDVAYGANGKYTYQYNKSGTIRFNNSTFGDPVPGVVKSGYYKLGSSQDKLNSGYYKISVKHSGKFLDVSGVSQNDGAYIHQWDWWNGDNQKWYLQSLGNEYYSLKVKHSGKCLDVSGVSQDNGAVIHQWACHGGDNQTYRIIDAGGGYYNIKAKHSGLCLDVYDASRDNGVRFIQYGCHSRDNQKFRLDSL